MSTSVIFIIGTVIFAITVYGSLIAGGLALGRRQESEDRVLVRTGDQPPAPSRGTEAA